MRDVIETRGDYELSVLPDDDPAFPHIGGPIPVLKTRFRRAGDIEIEAFNDAAKPYVALLDELYAVEGSFTMALLRLRQMHGSVNYETYGPNQGTDYKYIAFDTFETRAELGLPTWLSAGEDNVPAELISRIQAWAENDIWGWQIRKRRTFKKVYDDNGETQIGEEWQPQEFAYGCYSRELAIAEGLKVFTVPNRYPILEEGK